MRGGEEKIERKTVKEEDSRKKGEGKVRIPVADDHLVIRSGLRRIMEEEEDMDLCGEAEDAEELLRRVREEEWDLIVLDISLPDRSGLEVLREIKELQPDMKVLILSMHDEPIYVRQAFRLGASGYITKDCAMEEVVQAVRQLMRGERYLGRFLAEKLDGPGE